MIDWIKKKAWPAVKKQGRVALGVLKQAAFPILASLAWAIYFTSTTSPWSWTTFVSAWGSTLAVLSIIASQWFRVAKQIRDRDDFGSLQVGIENIRSIVAGLQQTQQHAGPPPEPIPTPPDTPEAEHPSPPTRRVRALPLMYKLHTEMAPEEFFYHARAQLGASQNYPAMWLAAMGFERLVRTAAARLDVPNATLRGIIDRLPEKYVSSDFRKELYLLARLRNNLAHPLPYNSSSAHDDELLPSRVVESFELGARRLYSVIEDAFPQTALL